MPPSLLPSFWLPFQSHFLSLSYGSICLLVVLYYWFPVISVLLYPLPEAITFCFSLFVFPVCNIINGMLPSSLLSLLSVFRVLFFYFQSLFFVYLAKNISQLIGISFLVSYYPWITRHLLYILNYSLQSIHFMCSSFPTFVFIKWFVFFFLSRSLIVFISILEKKLYYSLFLDLYHFYFVKIYVCWFINKTCVYALFVWKLLWVFYLFFS